MIREQIQQLENSQYKHTLEIARQSNDDLHRLINLNTAKEHVKADLDLEKIIEGLYSRLVKDQS